MKKQLLSALFASVFIISAFGQTSTGFLSPTSTTAPNDWSNAANAFTSDNSWASVSHGSGASYPFMFLSWDNGTTFDATYHGASIGVINDGTGTAGNSTDLWGHAWTSSELSNASFVVAVTNCSSLQRQGFNNFNFNIPSGAAITGIQVKVEGHVDSAFATDYLDQVQVNVHYTVVTGLAESTIASNTVSVYPNPTSSDFILKSNDHFVNARLSVYNACGQEVKQIKNISGQEIKLQRDNLPKGIYFIRLEQDNNIFTTDKLIIAD